MTQPGTFLKFVSLVVLISASTTLAVNTTDVNFLTSAMASQNTVERCANVEIKIDFTLEGQYTPTEFARADVLSEINLNPTESLSHHDLLTSGSSPICPVETINTWLEFNNYVNFFPAMEAQWEARDTNNVGIADAIIGFLKYDKEKELKPDGTKASLNIAACGRYASPLQGCNNFNIVGTEAITVSENIQMLNNLNHVGYKLFIPEEKPTIEDYDVEKTTNGRYAEFKTSLPTECNPLWKSNLIILAEKQKEIGSKGIPILAIWGVDLADEQDLNKLTEVTAEFLSTVNPNKLMLSGKRAHEIAVKAEDILYNAIKQSKHRPATLITGGADGVDSVALRLKKRFNKVQSFCARIK